MSPTADLEKILFHETTILARLDELASEIASDYEGEGEKLTAIAILHGGIIFTADLMRRIQLPLHLDTISVSSYHGGTESSGTVTFHGDKLPDVKGRHILLLDDILDTGRTLAAIKGRLLEEGDAASVKVCVLLSKLRPRAEDVSADYIGFEIGDEFVVGYGLDYKGRYRNLPLIGTLSESCIEED